MDLANFLLIRGDYAWLWVPHSVPQMIDLHIAELNFAQHLLINIVTSVHAILLLKTMLALFCSGHGWQGCSQPLADEGGGYPFPEEYHADFGTPKGICSVRQPQSLTALPLSVRRPAADSSPCVMCVCARARARVNDRAARWRFERCVHAGVHESDGHDGLQYWEAHDHDEMRYHGVSYGVGVGDR